MKLHLNLATRPLENKRSFLAFSAVIGAAEIAALVILSHSAYVSWRSSRELRAEIYSYQAQIRADRQLQQELKTFFQTPKATDILKRAAFLNSLIDERGFPWTKVFMDIEQTLPAGVRVVSIAPRLENNRAKVSLVVGADSDQDMIKFIQALENSEAFSGVQVQEERYVTQQGAVDKVQVQLTVWYETA
jgi:Tfp pilus assembly protein PilN